MRSLYKKKKKGDDAPLLTPDVVPSEEFREGVTPQRKSSFSSIEGRDDIIEKYSREVHKGLLNDLVASCDATSVYTGSVKLGVDDMSCVQSRAMSPSTSKLDAMGKATMFLNKDVRSRRKKTKPTLPPTGIKKDMEPKPQQSISAPVKDLNPDCDSSNVMSPLGVSPSSASLDIFGDLDDSDDKQLNSILDKLLLDTDVLEKKSSQRSEVKRIHQGSNERPEGRAKVNSVIDELLKVNDVIDETPSQLLRMKDSRQSSSNDYSGKAANCSRSSERLASKETTERPSTSSSGRDSSGVEDISPQISTIPVRNSSTLNGSSESTPELPLDPELLKSSGIVIVDPEQNGEYYHMDEDNKSLTNKDLLIIRTNKVEEKDRKEEDDDGSVISNLTEVTFSKSKRERARRIVEHLREATSDKIPDNGAWCGTDFPSLFFNDNDDLCAGDIASHPVKTKDTTMKQAIENTPKTRAEDLPDEEKDTEPTTKYDGEPNLSEDAELLFNAIVALTSKGGAPVDCGSYEEKVTVCISRIYIGTEDEVKRDPVPRQGMVDQKASRQDFSGIRGLRCTWNEPKLSHDIGVKFDEDEKGHAVVRSIIDESTAQKAGVQVGDILSFAVPLNNTFQGYEKACDFISRLELIGMRTCYRELFDLFLSKTSSGWPVALVFRRVSQAIIRFKRLPFGLLSVDMNIDIYKASTFVHELVTQSREYDYWREADGVYERIRGNIEFFMPLPCHRQDKRQISNKSTIGESFVNMLKGQNGNQTSARGLFIPISLKDENIFNVAFRRSALLAAYAEDSVGAVYVRVTSSFVGSGLAICRGHGGDWSSPCAVGANVSDTIGPNEMEFIVFIRESNTIQELTKQQRVELNCSSNENGEANCVFFIKEKESFICTNQMKCEIYSRDDLNRLFYKKKWNIQSILNGKISHPTETLSLFGALNRLESPSTHYPHPTPPQNLLKYIKHDWSLTSSCPPSENLESPLDMEGNLTLRELLQLFDSNPDTTIEDSREFCIFSQKLKTMLYDGVKVDYRWQQAEEKTEDSGEKKDSPKYHSATVTLRLALTPGDDLQNAVLRFITRSRMTPSQNRDKESFYHSSLELKIQNIVGISQLISNKSFRHLMSPQDKHSRKRFVCLEMEDGEKIAFLARTGKDASLLSCGLKLIIERILQEKNQD